MTEELAYLAGMFDGEGSVIIKLKGTYHGGKRYTSHTIQAHLGSTDKATPLLFQSQFGGSVCADKQRDMGNLACWQWELSATKCSEFLRTLYPFLRVKGHEAQVAIEFQDNKSNLPSREREEMRQTLHDLKANKRKLKPYIENQGGK